MALFKLSEEKLQESIETVGHNLYQIPSVVVCIL